MSTLYILFYLPEIWHEWNWWNTKLWMEIHICCFKIYIVSNGNFIHFYLKFLVEGTSSLLFSRFYSVIDCLMEGEHVTSAHFSGIIVTDCQLKVCDRMISYLGFEVRHMFFPSSFKQEKIGKGKIISYLWFGRCEMQNWNNTFCLQQAVSKWWRILNYEHTTISYIQLFYFTKRKGFFCIWTCWWCTISSSKQVLQIIFEGIIRH